jgi:hypothetical protein
MSVCSQLDERDQMAKFALLVEVKAKPGKESEVEAFLKKEAALVSLDRLLPPSVISEDRCQSSLMKTIQRERSTTSHDLPISHPSTDRYVCLQISFMEGSPTMNKLCGSREDDFALGTRDE